MLLRVLKAANWFIIFGLVIVTIVPAGQRPVSGFAQGLEHFVPFFIAGLIFQLAYPRSLRINLVYGTIFTLTLELSQIPLSTRHARLTGFIVDTLGVCLGMIASYTLRRSLNEKIWLADEMSKELASQLKSSRRHPD
jgi:VanZ family protein